MKEVYEKKSTVNINLFFFSLYYSFVFYLNRKTIISIVKNLTMINLYIYFVFLLIWKLKIDCLCWFICNDLVRQNVLHASVISRIFIDVKQDYFDEQIMCF